MQTQTHQRIIATGGIAAPQLPNRAIPATAAECVAQRFTGVRASVYTGSCFNRLEPHVIYVPWGDGHQFPYHDTRESALEFLNCGGYIEAPNAETTDEFPDNSRAGVPRDNKATRDMVACWE